MLIKSSIWNKNQVKIIEPMEEKNFLFSLRKSKEGRKKKVSMKEEKEERERERERDDKVRVRVGAGRWKVENIE